MIKRIYMLWFQGFDNAPHIVQQSVRSWKHHNPDWTICLLDDMNLHNYITSDDFDFSNHDLEYSHKADIIRLILLKKYGGLWIDATTICRKSLNEWLPQYIKEGFFVLDSPEPMDRRIASWFIYSEMDNYMLLKWYMATINYFKINMKAHTYFIIHYLFGWLYNSDITFQNMWKRVLKKSSNESFYLCRVNLPLTPFCKNMIDTSNTYIYKLTYKNINDNDRIDGTVLEYLYETTFNSKIN